MASTAPRKPFTGRHMAAVMVGGFGLVVGVNLFMAWQASSTFGGVVVENSYVASQNFNRWLDQAAQARALGWEAKASRLPDGRIRLTTANLPAGAIATATARHPVGREPDARLTFAPDGTGFTSREVLGDGRWILRLTISANGQEWRDEQNVL